jgi:uncharacterized protein YpmB
MMELLIMLIIMITIPLVIGLFIARVYKKQTALLKSEKEESKRSFQEYTELMRKNIEQGEKLMKVQEEILKELKNQRNENKY